MTQTATAGINFNVQSVLQLVQTLGNAMDASVPPANNDQFTAGTGAGKVSKKYCAQRSLAYNGSEALDLTALTQLGQTQDFSAAGGVKLLVIVNTGPGTNSLIVGGGTTPVLTNAIVGSLVGIPAGGMLVIHAGLLAAAGIPVDGTHKLLNIASGQEDVTKGVTYDILIVG